MVYHFRPYNTLKQLFKSNLQGYFKGKDKLIIVKKPHFHQCYNTEINMLQFLKGKQLMFEKLSYNIEKKNKEP